jgi:hypothetical protein
VTVSRASRSPWIESTVWSSVTAVEPSGATVNAIGTTVGLDLGPAQPVLRYGVASVELSALPAVGPPNIRGEVLEHDFDFARVEVTVETLQQLDLRSMRRDPVVSAVLVSFHLGRFPSCWLG